MEILINATIYAVVEIYILFSIFNAIIAIINNEQELQNVIKPVSSLIIKLTFAEIFGKLNFKDLLKLTRIGKAFLKVITA